MDAFVSLFSDPLVLAASIVVLLALVAAVVWAVHRSKTPSAPTPTAMPSAPVEAAPDAAEDLEPTSAGPADEPAESIEEPEEPTGESVEEAEAPAGPVEEGAPEEPSRDVPESLPSRMRRLRSRLAGSGALGRAIVRVLSRGDLEAADWEEIEDSLLIADLGLDATDTLMESLKNRVAIEGTRDGAKIRELLADELLALVDESMDRSLHLDPHEENGRRLPATVLMVGVNGTGKTTTVGKLARVLVAQDKTVLLGAADTFRAAAADQLCTWGERVGVDVVRSEREGADPASVAFDAVREGAERGVDVVLVDTAGRLQTKSTLMDELGKVKRVMEKQASVDEVLLVLDATTGQNGLKQAEVFAEVAGVTGIVLTKLDGSAKGGIVVSVQRALKVPVKFVGLGEGPDDLAPFDPAGFVDAIVNA